MKLREKKSIKKERENESIRLKINHEAQFPTDPMLNDNETNITS